MKIFRGKESFKSDDAESIIEACRLNNASAQRALIKLYYGYVKSIALRYSSDDDCAGEILNDSFLKVFQNINKYDEKQVFKAWIRTITVNTAIDYYRKNSQKPFFEDFEDQQIIDFDKDVISQISAEEILQLVRQLTPAYRTVFSLYVIDGYTHKEIAEKLGIQEGTSKSNLKDARKKLQKMILKTNPTLYSAYELKSLPSDEK